MWLAFFAAFASSARHSSQNPQSPPSPSSSSSSSCSSCSSSSYASSSPPASSSASASSSSSSSSSASSSASSSSSSSSSPSPSSSPPSPPSSPSPLPSTLSPHHDSDDASTQVTLRQFMQQHTNVLPYISQCFSWDCGLACAQMLLLANGYSQQQSAYRTLRKTCVTQSIWSIDIAYLLRRHNLHCVYYTVMKGVRPEYRNEAFYRRWFTRDSRRVLALFDAARDNAVRVVEAHVPLHRVVRALHARHLVVLLLDKRVLRCVCCAHPPPPSGSAVATTAQAAATSTCGFLGHYVVVFAHFAAQDVFLIKDPSARRPTCVVPAHVLEQARMAFGTDQDILFVSGLVSSPLPFAST